MANPNRKMVTIRRIDDVVPIEGADRIELAIVGGWRVVVKKGEFMPGDLAIYHEIDSFLDTTRPEYSFLEPNKEMEIDGESRQGHVLRTRKMRGQYSQGLLLDPRHVLPDVEGADLCLWYEEKLDISGMFGVVEYVKPLPVDGNKDFIGRYDGWIAPRTDAERIQNIDQKTFDAIKKCWMYVSLKIDGTSTTLLHDERTNSIRIFSHNLEYDTSCGMGQLIYQVAEREGIIEFCKDLPMVTVQCELIGPKIQGNRYGVNGLQLHVFSLWDALSAKYLDLYAFCCDDEFSKWVAPKLDISLADFDLPDDLLEYANGMRGNLANGRLDEGLVVHILGPGDASDAEWMMVQNALPSTMQVKAVSNAFLMKAKE